MDRKRRERKKYFNSLPNKHENKIKIKQKKNRRQEKARKARKARKVEEVRKLVEAEIQRVNFPNISFEKDEEELIKIHSKNIFFTIKNVSSRCSSITKDIYKILPFLGLSSPT
tara:strand:- start:1162 stop:1500 length:339 start_codon:yes stop_codon:yes gene_type:complete